jgi:Mrp family chromosome partitioning ATPase/capsular polysaccharide biosynthesis protein
MDQDQLLTLIGILRRRGWVVVQAVLIVAAAAAVVAARAPEPPYVATATLVYDLTDPGTRGTDADPTQDLAGPFLRRQAQVLRGSALLSVAASTLPGETAASLRSAVSVRVEDRDRYILLRSEGPAPAQPTTRVIALAQTYVASDFNDITRPLRDRADELRRQLESLEQRLTGINQRLATATARGEDPALLEAQQTAALNEYSALFSSEQRILNQIALQRKPMSILDAGTVTRNAAPSPIRRGFVGAVAGVVLGAAVLALWELLDRRIRSAEQARRASGLPVLVEVPRRRRRRRRTFAMLDQPTTPAADAARHLRTVVQLQGRAQPIRTLAVTSADPLPDRGLLSLDLAVAMARAGIPTVLVCADRADRRIESRLGLAGRTGLAEALDLVADGDLEADGGPSIQTRLAPLLGATEVPGLRVLTAGLLGGDRVSWTVDPADDLLRWLTGEAAIVIVDCPPMGAADAAPMTAACDATLVVATCGQTSTAALQRCARQLALAASRPLGLAVTRCDDRWTTVTAAPEYAGSSSDRTPDRNPDRTPDRPAETVTA